MVPGAGDSMRVQNTNNSLYVVTHVLSFGLSRDKAATLACTRQEEC